MNVHSSKPKVHKRIVCVECGVHLHGMARLTGLCDVCATSEATTAAWRCNQCHGTGEVGVWYPGERGPYVNYQRCTTCGGSGEVQL